MDRQRERDAYEQTTAVSPLFLSFLLFVTDERKYLCISTCNRGTLQSRNTPVFTAMTAGKEKEVGS